MAGLRDNELFLGGSYLYYFGVQILGLLHITYDFSVLP